MKEAATILDVVSSKTGMPVQPLIRFADSDDGLIVQVRCCALSEA